MIHKYPLRRTGSGKVTLRFIHIMEFALKQTGRNFGQLDKRTKKIVSRQFGEMRRHFESELNSKVGCYTEKQKLEELAKSYPLRKDSNGRPIHQIEHITQFALRETGQEWSTLSRPIQKSISQRLELLRKSYYTKIATPLVRSNSAPPEAPLRVTVLSSVLPNQNATPDAKTRTLRPDK